MKKQQKTRQSSLTTQQIIPVSDSLKKKFYIRQTFFFLYHLMRISLSIAVIVLIAQTDIQLFFGTQTYIRMQETATLWEKGVIVDIKTVSSYNCPEGYEEFTAATWPGTVEGCLCVVKFDTYDYFHTIPAACQGKLIDAGCRTISPKQEIPFVFWDADNLMCVKRIHNLTFSANLQKIQESQTCGQGTQYQIQSLSIVGCPITDLTNSSELSEHLPTINFSLSRQNNYPIIDIKMTEYQFCPDYDKPNISPNRFQNYVLEKIEIEHCNGSDPRVLEIDQKTQLELFENNQRVYDVVMELPGFPEPTDQYIYKLGIVRYPPWKYSCRSSQQHSIYIAKNNFSLIEQASTSQVVIAITILFISLWGLLYSLIYIGYNIFQLNQKRKNSTIYLTDAQLNIIDPTLTSNIIELSILGHFIVFVAVFVVGLIVAVVLGVQYERVDGLENWFRESVYCADQAEYFVGYLTDYATFFQNIIRTFLICILISVVFICIDILYFVWRLHKGDLSSQRLQDMLPDTKTEHNSDQQNIKDKQFQDKDNFPDDNNQVITEKNKNIFKNRQITEESMNFTENGDEAIEERIEEIMVDYSRNNRRNRKNKKALRTTDIQFD